MKNIKINTLYDFYPFRWAGSQVSKKTKLMLYLDVRLKTESTVSKHCDNIKNNIYEEYK